MKKFGIFRPSERSYSTKPIKINIVDTPGTNAIILAMERQEMNGLCGWGWDSARVQALHSYSTPEGITLNAATAHLADCVSCRTRRERLAAELAHIPTIADPDPAVATRITARVNARLQQKRRWLPVAGAATAGAIALAMAVVVWSPDQRNPALGNQLRATVRRPSPAGPSPGKS